jgi:protein-disulfide isomerase
MSGNNYRTVLWSSVLGTIAIVVVGMFLLVKYGNGSEPVYLPGVDEITADDHIFGPSDAKVRLLEYADFQCPACSVYNGLVKELKKEYDGRVAFIYRNFPIPGHDNGIPAAKAAGAAGVQGKFFEMADVIFENQSVWSTQNVPTLEKTLESYAQTLGLDMEKYRADYKSEAVADKINNDERAGIKAGINATPTFFINGKKIQPQSYDQFKRAIDDAFGQ